MSRNPPHTATLIGAQQPVRETPRDRQAMRTPKSPAASRRKGGLLRRPGSTRAPSPLSGISASPTARPSAAVGARPWFPVNTGILNTPGLAWRVHMHSEIAGLAPNSASSSDFASNGAPSDRWRAPARHETGAAGSLRRAGGCGNTTHPGRREVRRRECCSRRVAEARRDRGVHVSRWTTTGGLMRRRQTAASARGIGSLRRRCRDLSRGDAAGFRVVRRHQKSRGPRPQRRSSSI